MAKKIVKVDLSKIEEADNGYTTFYGGSWKISSESETKHGDGYGSDRSDSFFDDLHDGIAEVLDVTYDDVMVALDKSDVMLVPGGIYEFVARSGDGESVSVRRLVANPALSPSPEDALKWLDALGIEYKMVKGKPVVKLVDKDKIVKIFGSK